MIMQNVREKKATMSRINTRKSGYELIDKASVLRLLSVHLSTENSPFVCKG